MITGGLGPTKISVDRFLPKGLLAKLRLFGITDPLEMTLERWMLETRSGSPKVGRS